MLKEQAVLFNRISIALDFFTLILSLFIAYYLCLSLNVPLGSFWSYAWTLVIAIPLWTILLHKHKLYASIRRTSSVDIFIRLINVHVVGSVVLGFFIWIADKNHFSRFLFISFITISFLALLSEKIIVRKSLGYFRSRGYNFRNLLIVGTKQKAQKLHSLVEEHQDWGLRIVGFLQALEDEPLQEYVDNHKVLGYASELIKVCKSFPVDEVVFCLPKNLVIDAESYLKKLEEMGITVRMVIDFYDVKYTKKELSMFHDELPIMTFHSKCLDAQQLLMKRMLDITGSAIGLLVTGILFPFIALAIKLDSPGPLFFGQERVGESGRTFKCWKFRSMYIDAEERKKELMAQNEMNGAIFKIKDDPRITKVGKFLRKTSLDELPQFWNVLKGEMSLVGTRPPTPGEVSEYENWHRRRISIKPGITGMWQVSGRNQINDFDEIVRLDIAYIDNWSLGLDIKLLLKTFKVVFAREGSC